MDVWYTVVKFFSNGGVFMYPIVLVLALGVAIAVERFITLTLVAKKNRDTWQRLEPIMRKGEFDQARDLANKDDSTIAQLLSAGLARQGAVRRREDVDRAMEETLMAIIPRVEKRTHYLATFANMSTLAGLLGTIIGLIDAFTAVSNADIADNELHGVRPDGRDSARARALAVADEDHGADRQPRNGGRQDRELDRRASAIRAAGDQERRTARRLAERACTWKS
jgi:biopolymer transport protein ExbB/TolQ